MIIAAAIILCSFIITTVIGHFVHIAGHQKWSGIFYKSHLDHHIVQYPFADFTSDKYRSSGKNNGAIYFPLIFSPIMIAIAIIFWQLNFPIWTTIVVIGTMIATGVLHVEIHDSFHLNKTVWGKLPFYQRWKNLHKVHHKNVQKNFGIFYFGIDRATGTYKTLKESKVSNVNREVSNQGSD